MKRLTLIAIALGLAGCISSGPLAQLPPVPDGQAARIVFVRPSSLLGATRTFAIVIDQVRVYGLDNGEHVTLTVAAGTRILDVQMTESNSAITQTGWPTAALDAQAGKTYYYRVTSGVSYRLDRLTEAEGQQLMQKTYGQVTQ